MTLRFYLDNDVDVTCAAVIRAAGHECWTASQAATQNDDDDEQTVYAVDKGAVIITHDREFTNRRKRLPIGHHVRLKCHQMDGPALLEQALDRIVSFLAASSDMVLEVSPGRGGVVEVNAWFGSGGNRSSSHP
jgi:predicted nuclease of predicted toxin-antitoxin system